MDSVEGIMIAPPTPISARAPMSCHGSVTNTASSDAPPNSTRPMMRKSLRPYRSDRLPAVSSSPAKAST